MRARPIADPIDWPKQVALFATLTTAALVVPFIPSSSLRLLVLPPIAGALGLPIGAAVRVILDHARPRQRVTMGTVVVPMLAAMGGGTLAMLGTVVMSAPQIPNADWMALFLLATWGSATAWFQAIWFVPFVSQSGRHGGSTTMAILLAPCMAWLSAAVGFVASFVAGVVATIIVTA